MGRAKYVLSITAITLLAGSILGALSIFARRKLQSKDPSPHVTQEKEKPGGNSYGTRLPLKFECAVGDTPDSVESLPLPSGHILIGTCDKLFMLDSQKHVVWEYTVPQLLFDFTYIKATGLVYGTAGDNTMFILEASSGKQLEYISRNGSAAFGEVKPYGKDMCLITNNNWGYRDRLNDPSIEDGVTAWQGTEALWSVELPPNAKLLVDGEKIFAITKTNYGIFIKEIAIPKDKKK